MCDFWKIRLEDGDLERRIFQIVILTGIHISTAPAWTDLNGGVAHLFLFFYTNLGENDPIWLIFFQICLKSSKLDSVPNCKVLPK